MSELPVVAPLSQQEIIERTQQFVHWKLVSQKMRIVDHHDLRTHFWLTTAVSVQTPWRNQAEYDADFAAELKLAQNWLLKAAARDNGPEEIKKCFDNMIRWTRQFMRNYADCNAEASAITENAGNYLLNWGQRPAAIAQCAATVALGWIGLVSGPAVVGLDLASKSFLISTGEASVGFIVKKLATGVAANFGVTVAENWADAVTARFVVTQTTTNSPGFIHDTWPNFFRAAHNAAMLKVNQEVFYETAANANAGIAMHQPGVKVDSNEARVLATVRETTAARAQAAAPKPAAVPRAGSTGLAGGALKVLKGAAYLITYYQTGESLYKLYKNVKSSTR